MRRTVAPTSCARLRVRSVLILAMQHQTSLPSYICSVWARSYAHDVRRNPAAPGVEDVPLIRRWTSTCTEVGRPSARLGSIVRTVVSRAGACMAGHNAIFR